MSDVRDFLGSKAFAGYRSGLEGQQKVTLGVMARIDNVTRAIGMLGKALGRRR